MSRLPVNMGIGNRSVANSLAFPQLVQLGQNLASQVSVAPSPCLNQVAIVAMLTIPFDFLGNVLSVRIIINHPPVFPVILFAINKKSKVWVAERTIPARQLPFIFKGNTL